MAAARARLRPEGGGTRTAAEKGREGRSLEGREAAKEACTWRCSLGHLLLPGLDVLGLLLLLENVSGLALATSAEEVEPVDSEGVHVESGDAEREVDYREKGRGGNSWVVIDGCWVN